MKCPFTVLAGLILTAALRAGAQNDWRDDLASLRVDVEILSAPSTQEAGVIAIIPDGGLLPHPVPDPAVYGPDGKPLPCQVLWHNPAIALAVVFAPPANGKAATIYFRGVAARATLKNNGELRPSLLLFTRETPAASLEAAAKLPASLLGASDVLMGTVPLIGQRGNIHGGDDNYLSYYTGWIRRAKPGRVYFATISDEGSDLHVDGKSVASWPGLHGRWEGAKGQFGGWVDLSAGLHRIEYFHFEREGDQEAQAAWRIPGETKGDLPVTIPADAFLRSGQARAIRAAFRDGRPVAAVAGNRQPVSYFWFLKAPVNLYRLETTLADANSSDTTYTWIVDPTRQTQGRTLDWLCEGDVPATITLIAENKRGTTRVTVPMLAGLTPEKAQVERLADRVTYRNVLLAMCRAAPAGKDPCARWSPDLWATFVAVSEPYRGYELLLEVFSRSLAAAKALKQDERLWLTEAFLEMMRIYNPKDVSPWIGRLLDGEKDPDLRWRIREELFDYTLYDAGDAAAARKVAADMQADARAPEEIGRAQIRMGDVERAAGNGEEAIRLYSAAQDLYRAGAAPSGKPVRMRPHGKGRPDGAAETGMPRAQQPVLRATQQNWKTFAVQEAAFLATIRGLIRNGDLQSARNELRRWEIEVPLCKISGDYPLAEAEYYMAAENYARALAGLRLYRKGVDVSSSLPEAMELELDCLARLKKDAEARELATDIRKRFPNHPIAERARKVLERER